MSDTATRAPDFRHLPWRALRDYYRGEFVASTQVNLAYRGQVMIWVVTSVIQPLVMIVVWQTVAGPSGTVGGYTAGQFVTYFAILMVVEHLTFIWLMWEFEWRIREGAFSPLLLRPIHPIHKDIIDNVSYKIIGLFGVLPGAILLMIVFGADLSGIRPLQLLAFIPALIGAAVLRFAIEWVLALSAFWLTKVSALNNLYFSVQLFLGGGFAPLAVMPAAFGVVAQWAPFSWSLAFPVEVAMGRRTGLDILYGYAMQAGWIVIAIIVLRLVWSRALRHYSAVGA
ncbi:ABC transporter permease [Microlunatus sp. GCM10028923]|uniref:ABC transporter permease n=1 Tax=Microlunatus sp. GCM10028923 TaxID=3273400 RepID=UPI00361DFF83